MATENPFVKLFAIDFKDHLEVKKSGNTELKYVSWAYAWAEVKKLYPAASYEVKKFNGLPYVYDPITGFMVYTSVTIEGVSHEMWLPVLDGANKAMKATPYTYTTPKWDYNPQTRRREKIGMEERTVEAASMFDVNKAIMRCLVKNLAMFGLGLYVYAGEDLPGLALAAVQGEAEQLLGLLHRFAGQDLHGTEIALGEGVKIHHVLEDGFDLHVGEVDLLLHGSRGRHGNGLFSLLVGIQRLHRGD